MEHPHSESHTKKKEHPHDRSFWAALFIITLLGLGAGVYGYKHITDLHQHVLLLTENLSSTTIALSDTKGDLLALRSETVGISQTLSATKEDLASAHNSISAVQGQVAGTQQTLGTISGTVSTLQKLSTTDQELLRKYSKVYFLNENYTPAHLSPIPQDYVYSNITQESFISEALPYLIRMIADAKAQGVTFYVSSGYRSFNKQQALKSQYSVVYGEGANTFAADQGYSEHQLGTTVDFITSGLGGQLTEEFANTPAFQWLKGNAHKYGFEMSYPAGNAYYVYEPWHWRFVGVKLATELHNRNTNFYDFDQRVIDEYLVNLFD